MLEIPLGARNLNEVFLSQEHTVSVLGLFSTPSVLVLYRTWNSTADDTDVQVRTRSPVQYSQRWPKDTKTLVPEGRWEKRGIRQAPGRDYFYWKLLE